MSIPRAKITVGRINLADWECDLLDRPHGSSMRGFWVTCSGCDLCDDWADLGFATEEAAAHLRDVHGVRTVGSLTADDIGKWIEVGDFAGILSYIGHDRLGDNGQQKTLLEIRFERPWLSSSTVCRVTEAKP